MKVIFKLKGLDCANCAMKIEEAVSKIEGVEETSVSFFTTKMILEYDENRKESILEKTIKAIKKIEPDIKIEEM